MNQKNQISLLQDVRSSDFPRLFREEISKEKVANLDFSGLQDKIENWWVLKKNEKNINKLKASLTTLVIDNMSENQQQLLENIGMREHHIAAVLIENIFKTPCPKLSLVVNETFAELCGLSDITYPYEDHKTLYLKAEGLNYTEWGRGLGSISLHSDDLYEEVDIDYLALTYCWDKTHTPSKCCFMKDIVRGLSDTEISQLCSMKAVYTSGKNVEKTIQKTRDVVSFDPLYGFRFYIDLRIDKNVGKRMVALNAADEKLIDKIREIVKSCACIATQTNTGTFLILSNLKVLHGRDAMNLKNQQVIDFIENNDWKSTPRLVYRSKGCRKPFSFTEYTNLAF